MDFKMIQIKRTLLGQSVDRHSYSKNLLYIPYRALYIETNFNFTAVKSQGYYQGIILNF